MEGLAELNKWKSHSLLGDWLIPPECTKASACNILHKVQSLLFCVHLWVTATEMLSCKHVLLLSDELRFNILSVKTVFSFTLSLSLFLSLWLLILFFHMRAWKLAYHIYLCKRWSHLKFGESAVSFPLQDLEMLDCFFKNCSSSYSGFLDNDIVSQNS